MVDLKNTIRHVVLLMFENRSFDHMLGDLQQVKAVDGVQPGGVPRKIAFEGVDYLQEAGAARILTSDLKHEANDVTAQLSQGNSGFIRDFARAREDAGGFFELEPALVRPNDGVRPSE